MRLSGLFKTKGFEIGVLVFLFFLSGLLNNVLFRVYPSFNFHSLFFILKGLVVLYLFYNSTFRNFKFHKWVYLGFIIVALVKLITFFQLYDGISDQLLLTLNFIGILIICLTYGYYLFSDSGLKVILGIRFWFVFVEIVLAYLYFSTMSGHVSMVQLTWISFFSMLIALTLLIRK